MLRAAFSSFICSVKIKRSFFSPFPFSSFSLLVSLMYKKAETRLAIIRVRKRLLQVTYIAIKAQGRNGMSPFSFLGAYCLRHY